MVDKKIWWWIIVISMAIIIIGAYYWKDDKNQCCTLLIDDPLVADGVYSYTYCKKDGKYFRSGVGGIGGVIPEQEITEQEYNSARGNGDCN